MYTITTEINGITKEYWNTEAMAFSNDKHDASLIESQREIATELDIMDMVSDVNKDDVKINTI